jgi:hypothetical protein
MKTFRYRLYDRKYPGEEIGTLGGETMEAESKTEVRAVLKKLWKRDTPRDARNCGFTPWHDVKIVWVEDR